MSKHVSGPSSWLLMLLNLVQYGAGWIWEPVHHATGQLTAHVMSLADEREFLLRWLQHNTASPVTREPLHKDLRRNYALKHTIEDWLTV